MLSIDDVCGKIADFKKKHGVQEQDEQVATTIHLMNTHRLDLPAAQDRTSPGSGDKGIDGWHCDEKTWTLYVYQSKLSNAKATALAGFEELVAASNWIGSVLESGELGTKIANTALYNLVTCLEANRDSIRNVVLQVISPFDPNELEDCSDFSQCRLDLVNSALNKWVTARDGRINVQPAEYNLTSTLPANLTAYDVTSPVDPLIKIGKRTQLDVVFLNLASLVELLRRRGNRLFEKNVRLYLNTKESKARLEHPLEDTLERICNGTLDPNVFPFYHVGITLTVNGSTRTSAGSFSLENPNVINGCQTINIADRFLKRLEKERAKEKIQRFSVIPVLAKIVVAANDDQVREIANCNNRQNPIEGWQLFCNEPIQIEIDTAFRESGIFYERQKGKFDAESRLSKFHSDYPQTNNTYLTIEQLGQLIAICRRELQLAAKPSDVFSSKQEHDRVFDRSIPRSIHDAVWAANAIKAAKKGLVEYLRLPTHQNQESTDIFKRPLVRQAMHYSALMYLYQNRQELAADFGFKLFKISPPKLREACETFYRKGVLKMKNWYWEESKKLSVEVSWNKLQGFLTTTFCNETGLDPEGPMPFTRNQLDWSEWSHLDSEVD